ncbi:MAG: ATP-binding protein [Myxococcota bacterium]
MAATDPSLQLLLDGVTAVAGLLVDPDVETAQADWDAFERRVREAGEEVPLADLTRRFRLDSFELKCLVLGLASHVEPRVSDLVARTGRELFTRVVTVRLALERFCRDPVERIAARRSFLPSAPLLHHRLVTVRTGEAGAGEGLLARRIELTTPALRHLLQEDELSESVNRIARLTRPRISIFNVILDQLELQQIRELVQNHGGYRELIEEWGFDKVLPYGRGLTLLFSGPSGTGKTLLAHALAGHVDKPLLSLSAADLPDKDGVDAALQDLFTEATMRDAFVVIDECEALFGRDDRRKATAFHAMEAFEGILVLTTNHPERLDDALERRIIYHLPFELPEADLRRQIWEVHLPQDVPLDDIGYDELDALANTYDFAGGTIKNAILVAVNRAIAKNPKAPVLTRALLEEGCRSQLRYALEDLTVRTTTNLRMGDIVLPEDQDKKVCELLAAIRNQSIVLNAWGFGKKLVTGKGITTLFDGPPGTGKTLCAEIIAGEFDRPLHRVNIPEVVSKWVGETEKHIRQIFQEARISHAMLLFDEADSLFSARTANAETATDRYANMEVNLLLQEIERFPGVCILTTNFYGSLDRALIRRIQFRISFEEPDVEQRRRIWETLCPPQAPLGPDADFAELARRYELTGGMIKNALLRAAYWAADDEGIISQEILHDACRDEYKAAGKVARDASAIPDKKPRIHRGLEEEERQRAEGSEATGDGGGDETVTVTRPA